MFLNYSEQYELLYKIMVSKKIVIIAIAILFLAKNSEELCKSSAGVTTCENEIPQPGKPLKINNYKGLLSFAKGNVAKIPSGTFKLLPELTILQLSNNQINKLESGSFEGLQELTQLSLYNNKLVDLPRNVFESCPKLKILDLGMNQIQAVEAKVLENLLQLEDLNLSFNKLKSVPAEIKQLKSLKILKLNNNQIEKLNSKQFGSLTKLEILDLNDNKIAQISNEAFKGLTSLKVLNLVNNYLNNLNVDDLVNDLKALSTLKLNINSFDCSTLEGIVNNLKRKRIEVPRGFSKNKNNVLGMTCKKV